jgi:hydrogenase maturation protein HypF
VFFVKIICKVFIFRVATRVITMERRAVVVRGIVQGVGFRPFVFNLATRLRLVGFVKNQTGTVLIEIEGDPPALEHFLAELSDHPPPLAQIEHVSWQERPLCGEQDFRIETSTADPTSTIFISPDVATCQECLAEVLDPADRRHGYPFLNCTNCGPRLTIITGAPYDRQRTTMAVFPMCAACRAEYENPRHRRFHAQPTACPGCGPKLQLLEANGTPIPTDNALCRLVDALIAGRIAAVKGLGGFHLVCDAANPMAVAELRRRKHRDEKPFAVMVRDLTEAEALAEIDNVERELLQSPRRPIVLLRKRRPTAVADGVAPGNPLLGIMLPYTPLHHLLLRAASGRPLVMTSGNRSDEPIAYQDDDALRQLAGIADLFLVHNRPIQVRCDDSVTRVVDGVELPIRRSRGYAPRPVELPLACPLPVLALGGQLKATFALGRGSQAFLSHHLGDLDHYEAYRAFTRDLALYRELFGIDPDILAHDLHPDYNTTRFAQEQAEQAGIPLLSVQHHHAHMAACMAEHGLNEAVIGVAFDGTGFGTDGAVWGGELLVGTYRQFRRAAHLRYVGLPGGDQAIREPWRMALTHLLDAGVDFRPLTARVSPMQYRGLKTMLERRLNTPLTSSAGRLFDAVASLLGIRDRVGYEGQAAVELEWLAAGHPPDYAYPFEVISVPEGDGAAGPLVIDTRPLIRAIVVDASKNPPELGRVARRFHATVAEIIAVVCGRIRQAGGPGVVVLSGGVFLNALLTSETSTRLSGDGFRVYRHRLVPPNDGGLSLGQLAVAAAQLS